MGRGVEPWRKTKRNRRYIAIYYSFYRRWKYKLIFPSSFPTYKLKIETEDSKKLHGDKKSIF